MKTKILCKVTGVRLILLVFLVALSVPVLSSAQVFGIITAPPASGIATATWTSTTELTYNSTGPGSGSFQLNSSGDGVIFTYNGSQPPSASTTMTLTDTSEDNGDDPTTCKNVSKIVVKAPYTTVTTATLYAYTSNSASDSYLGSFAPPSSCQTFPPETVSLTNTYTAIASQNTADQGCPINDGDALQWLLCPVATIGQAAITTLSGWLQDFLYVPGSFVNSFQSTFDTFRNIGEALLVMAGLVMVISQAVGMEMFAAYTIRRALPRIVIAAIGMAIAWPILQFVITFFDDIGTWAQALILAATSDPNAGTPSTAFSGGIADLIGGVIAIAVSAFLVISFIGTLLLALFVAFLILTIRQLVIVVCVILAPLAIASSVLPGTSKLWDLWRKTFLSTMMMFPIIMAFLGAGLALSYVAGQTAKTTASPGNLPWDFMAVAALAVPLLMLPFSYFLAGGLMGNISRAVVNNGVTKGVSEGISKRRQARWAGRQQKFLTGGYKDAGLGKVANTVGRHARAGRTGFYGFGGVGKKVMAQQSTADIEGTMKANPQLSQLANDDPANAVMALSGGTRAGAVLAAHRLFGDTAMAQEAIDGAQAAGITRANATAALTTLAQNKSRVVAAGDYEVIQEGIHRLAGNNKSLEDSLAYGFQFNSRQAGRSDLGGSWHTEEVQKSAAELYNSAVQRGRTTSAREATSVATSIDGLRRTSVSQLLSRGHPRAVGQTLKSIQYMMENGNSEQRVLAGQAILEMQNSKNYATVENKSVINKWMADQSIDPASPSETLADTMSRSINELNRTDVERGIVKREAVSPVTARELTAGASVWSTDQVRNREQQEPEEQH